MDRSAGRLAGAMIVLALSLAGVSAASPNDDRPGRLSGLVNGDDGRRPLTDAIVLLRETASGRICQSEATGNNGSHRIGYILPGANAVGIHWGGKENHVDALIILASRRQMARFTLPKPSNVPGCQIRCSSPACFLVISCGRVPAAGVTAGITYGIVRIMGKEVSLTGI